MRNRKNRFVVQPETTMLRRLGATSFRRLNLARPKSKVHNHPINIGPDAILYTECHDKSI
jgi:hypothetical protein